jgi:Flp pilus assembly protein TadD
MERHQLPEAVDEFVQALRINPADDNAHNDLGIVLAQGGDFENAAEQFSEAVRFNPANADARRNLGFMKDKLKSRSK